MQKKDRKETVNTLRMLPVVYGTRESVFHCFSDYFKAYRIRMMAFIFKKLQVLLPDKKQGQLCHSHFSSLQRYIWVFFLCP